MTRDLGPVGADGGQPPGDADAPGPSRAVVAGRARRFQQAIASRMADEVRAVPVGTLRLTPSLPLAYSLSDLEVTRPAALREVLPAVDEPFADAGLHHRSASTHLPEVAWSLGPALVDRGWRVERLVVMAHDGATAPPVSPIGFRAVDLDRWAAPGRAFTADNEWGRDPGVQDQLAQRDRRLVERLGALLVLADDGSAGCHVYRHGRTAQIEQVHVLSEARGQGLGHGLMAAALQVCGDAELVIVVADADDWPQRWYARLGFRAVASSWTWRV